MTGEENPDPIGEYIKICPYCSEEFTAGHMNRQFCPEKNGFKDYCKNRYKRQHRAFTSDNQAQDEYILTDHILSENPEKQHTKDLQNNQNLMAATLGSLNSIQLYKHYLKKIGVVYEAYEMKHKLPDSDLNVLIYGPFALAWISENKIVLTLKKNLRWIQ